jgi:hypothetical protein
MGFLKHLLFWPVTGPLFLLDFSMEKVEGVVREELTDDSQVKAELLELQLLLELGDINEDEYVAREAAIMSRLRDVRDWRERFGMGVAGGPVRVADSSEEEAEALLELPPPPESDSPQVARPGEASIDLHLDWDE